MEKIYGATEAHNSLTRVGREKYELIYGHGEDAMGGYDWRERYDHKPTQDEIRATIEGHINQQTDARILSGFVWDGVSVWLSKENQMNFKAAYDLAVQTEGRTLPVKLKLGEDADGAAVYRVFESVDDFSDFYKQAVAFIISTLQEGWEEKDGVNYGDFNDGASA